MATRILITGASGFIGRHLVEEALDRHMDVYAAVRGSSNRKHLKDPRIRFFEFDLDHPEKLYLDLKKFQKEMGGFQFVVHNAAVTIPKEEDQFVSGNADFTREFARMVMETQKGISKFVFMSSMASIGPGDPVTMQPIDEKYPRRPVTPYGHSKLLAERFIHEIEELPYIILRPTGVYGPGDVKFALRVIGMMKKGIELSIGPADQVTSFIHAADLAHLAIQACVSTVQREDFNVADGNYYTQQEFNDHLKKALGVRTVPMRIPASILEVTGFAAYHVGRLTNKPIRLSHLKMRELTARNWKVDITKSKQLLGFKPKYDLKKGLNQVVESLGDSANS